MNPCNFTKKLTSLLVLKIINMKRTILTIAIVVLSLSYSQAQDYITAVGVRGGYFSGISVKQILSDDHALEGIFSARPGGFNVTALAETYAMAFKDEQWHWYYGAGAHVGIWPEDAFRRTWSNDTPHYSRVVVGIDAIAGLEYTFEQVPINLSIDYKPSLNFLPLGFWADGLAFSARYTIR